MKNAQLILIVAGGIVAVAFAMVSFDPTANARHNARNYDQPLPGRSPLVAAPDLVTDPAQYHLRRVVLDGVWHREFEVSSLEVVEGQKFFIWVSLWDSKEFASEAAEFFERVAGEDEDFSMQSSVRLRAEGSFYYRVERGFGHLGHAQALFLVDRILMLERIPKKPKSPEPSPQPSRRVPLKRNRNKASDCEVS